MYDYITIATAVPDVDVANVKYNLEQILTKIDEASKQDSQFVVFPELAITGYTCADLFFHETLIKEAMKAVGEIVSYSKKVSQTIIVGAPVCIDDELFNCAIIIASGKIQGVAVKTFIPNTNEFYEKRWFSSAADLKKDSVSEYELGISSNTEPIAIGNNLVFNLDNQVSFGVEICEDLWTAIPPSNFMALSGAHVLFNISASNETIAKSEYRKQLVAQQSGSNIAVYAYCSAGFNESTTDLVFCGHSIIAENGSVLKENDKLIDNDYLMIHDVDIGKIKADRIKNKVFKDCATVYGSLNKCKKILIITSNEYKNSGERYKLQKLPFVPQTKEDRITRCNDIFAMQVAGLKKRLLKTNCKPVIGVSGGLDSTLALLVSVQAIKELGRDISDVVGITMPCFGTSERTYNNSLTLMKNLGVTTHEISIKEACINHFKDIGHDGVTLDLTYENAQARERTQVLMDFAGKIGGLVVGTGDLSELALGWCTYNADHMSMYSVNSSIPKTLVRWLIDSVIQFNIFESSSVVLLDILDTPISPELLPPDETGKIAQETESIVGPYALHDFFMYYVLRFGFAPDKIFHLAKRAFDGDFSDEIILKWLKTFYHRFFTQQFKRSCLPDGVKVGSICISPRGDLRMPSDSSAKIWLEQLENL